MTIPRSISFALLFSKSLAGFGAGAAGMLILLIFALIGIGTVGAGEVTGPFLTFAALIMGFITALITNCLGVFVFGLVDRVRYQNLRGILEHVLILNILIFIFLLPIYFFVILGSEQSLQTIFLVTTLQLLSSAQASVLVLELMGSTNARDNLIAVYGMVFGLLASIVINLLLYNIGQNFSSAAELAVGGSGGKGATIVLFAILPVTWFFFGFWPTAIEMFYRWVYEVWGIDFLNREQSS